MILQKRIESTDKLSTSNLKLNKISRPNVMWFSKLQWTTWILDCGQKAVEGVWARNSLNTSLAISCVGHDFTLSSLHSMRSNKIMRSWHSGRALEVYSYGHWVSKWPPQPQFTAQLVFGALKAYNSGHWVSKSERKLRILQRSKNFRNSNAWMQCYALVAEEGYCTCAVF